MPHEFLKKMDCWSETLNKFENLTCGSHQPVFSTSSKGAASQKQMLLTVIYDCDTGSWSIAVDVYFKNNFLFFFSAVDKLPSDDLCKICMDAPIECVILECGHMATCTGCGKVLSECPICRQYIVRVVRFFRA